MELNFLIRCLFVYVTNKLKGSYEWIKKMINIGYLYCMYCRYLLSVV